MIILRNKNFALPDSRKGIGWVNDKNGKLDSEKYFKAARDAADKAEARGLSDKEITKKVKSAALGAEINTVDRIKKRNNKKK